MCCCILQYVYCDRFLASFSKCNEKLTKLIQIQAQPHYVRCINTNSQKTAGLFEPALVVHQLRCGGVVEAVRVTRARYPTRFLVEDFVRRFSRLQNKGSANEYEQLQQMHDIMRLAGLVEGHDYQVGITKVFLRDGRIQVGILPCR